MTIVGTKAHLQLLLGRRGAEQGKQNGTWQFSNISSKNLTLGACLASSCYSLGPVLLLLESHYLFLTQTQHSIMVSENSKAGQEGLVGSIGLTVPLSREDPADLESHFQGALIEG